MYGFPLVRLQFCMLMSRQIGLSRNTIMTHISKVQPTTLIEPLGGREMLV